MPTSADELVALLDILGEPGLLLLFIIGILTEWIVTGRQHRRVVDDKQRQIDQLWELHEVGLSQSKRLVGVARRAAS